MKIFILSSALDMGGAETHIYTLAKELLRLGQDVTVGSSGGRTAERLASLGVRTVYSVADVRRPFLTFYHGLRLYFFIRREGFEILHGHTRPACFILNIISRLTGIPLVTTVHASFRTSPFYRGLSAWGSATVAVSEDLREYVCENYSVDAQNVYVIENGIAADEFYCNEAEEKPFRIVFASRLDRDCSAAAFALCRLVSVLSEEYPKVEVVICGGGECLYELRQAVEQMDVHTRKRISLLGWVEDMGTIMRSASLFVGVSRAAVEAMLCGVPTVLAGDEGFLGLIDGEAVLSLGAETNFCCRGQDFLSDEVLLLHIRRAFDMDRGRRAAVISLMQGRVSEAYGAAAMAKRTLEIYRELSGRRGKSHGRRILLCGYYGYGNLGDNALLRASVRRARDSFTDGIITAMSAHPWRDSMTFGIPCIGRMNFFRIIPQLMRTDVFVFGGGTLLQESSSLRSFFYYAFLIRVAAFLGCRVELWGNGLGDFRHSFSLRVLKGVLKNVDYIGLRDRRSYELAMLMTEGGEGLTVVLEGDLALSLCPSSVVRIDRLLRRWGLTDCGQMAHFAVIAVKGTADRESIAELELYMCELWEKGVEFLYIPMYGEEDEAESLRLRSVFGGVVARHISEGDALGLIGRSRFVCSMRFHALVFASMSGVPFLAFGRDPKVVGFSPSSFEKEEARKL